MSTSISPNAILNFTVSDSGLISRITVTATFSDRTEEIYDTGIGFREPYDASTATPSGTDLIFAVTRAAAWLHDDFTLEIKVVDVDGNTASSSVDYSVTGSSVSTPTVPVPDLTMTEELAYDALYQCVGDGLRGPPNSIVETWRRAKARGLAAATLDAQAMQQAFPNLATDFLKVYEELLQFFTDENDPLETRQQQIAERYTRTIDSAHPSLEEQLVKIDPSFTIINVPIEQSTTTDMGVRAFDDWNPGDALASGPAYGIEGRDHSIFPNYSSDFILYVQLDNGGGLITGSDKVALTAAQDVLNESLPAWVDFRLFKSVGFILDQDLLDVTVFGDGI